MNRTNRRHPSARHTRLHPTSVIVFLVIILAAVVVTTSVSCSPGPTTSATRALGTPATGENEGLALPRIPWEGGPEYWNEFANARAGGWSDPTFFPIIATFDGISSDAEVSYDKSVGINTYMGLYAGTPFNLFTDNRVYWIGAKLNNSFNPTSPNWVGDFLDDEVDGRYTPVAGRAHLRELVNRDGNDRKFKWANFTSLVIGGLATADAVAYLNDFTDVATVDMFWYTTPFCSETPYRGGIYIVPILQSNCRTASSYGRVLDAVRMREASAEKLQPLWGGVELLNGGPAGGPFTANITPGQLQGAVMNSIIHEARGIVYFNQSEDGPCMESNIIRQSQVDPSSCGMANVRAASRVDALIRSLAPVINTQSYKYHFGPGLDTMLKTYDGYAYIFAMINGSSQAGSRTFELPRGVSGRVIEVVSENRTLRATASGSFTDKFAQEYTYHIYRVKL